MKRARWSGGGAVSSTGAMATQSLGYDEDVPAGALEVAARSAVILRDPSGPPAPGVEPADTPAPDAGLADAATPDGSRDSGDVGSASPDAAPFDAGPGVAGDASTGDAGAGAAVEPWACSCGAGGPPAGVGALLAAALLARRRRVGRW
jgi:MYXO-CTERM domain-containing protein